MNNIQDEIKKATEEVERCRKAWHLASPEYHDSALYALMSAEMKLNALIAEAKREKVTV